MSVLKRVLNRTEDEDEDEIKRKRKNFRIRKCYYDWATDFCYKEKYI